MQTRRLLTFVYLSVLVTLSSAFVHAEVNVTALNVSPGLINHGQFVNITVNASTATPNLTVLAEIARSNGSRFNVTMSNFSGNENQSTFNFSLTVSGFEPAGGWNITILANDSAGNTNFSVRTNFTVTDTTAPRVTNQNVTPGVINQGQSVNITVTFSDETARDN
ncbi:hypothetical protein HY641_03880, partial [Candidatus Woesearchaeota archaeon]|nr:hypothetical protein [Candidatus Woesearchaeota archaeon]